MAYTSDYPPFYVTVDIVVLAIIDDRLHALMIRRGGEPYAGTWALPGGFVEIDEDLRAAAERELEEETGVRIGTETLTQVRTYGAPDRDPRSRVVSVAWLTAFPEAVDVRAGTDAAHAAWLPVDELVGADPAVGKATGGKAVDGLAFDHAEILRDAVAAARERLVSAEPPLLASGFTGGREFTLSRLRAIHEAVLGRELDPAGFRRTVERIVEPTGRVGSDEGGDEGPAELFRLRGGA
jgi:8-oxo-dGTP diphosphatase